MSKRTPSSPPVRSGSVWTASAVAIGLSTGTLALAGDDCPGFDLPVVVDVAPGAWWVEAHDFDGDGHLDLGVTAELASTFVVLKGLGDGTFAPDTVSEAGSAPREFLVTDVTGDGIADAVVANTFALSDSLTVLVSDGTDGTWERSFTPVSVGGVGPNPTALATGDLDGDGWADLVVTARDGNAFSVLVGTGDESLFESRGRVPTGVGPSAIELLHVDDDEWLDAVVVCTIDRVCQVFLGTGNGTSFALDASYGVGDTPRAIAWGRFDADEASDLAIANATSASVAVLLAISDGGVRTGDYAPAVYYPVGDGAHVGPGFLAAADVTGDGIVDIVTPNAHDDDMSVLVGMGDGTFGTPVSFALGPYPRCAIVADVDEDTRADVVVTDSFAGDVYVLTNACAEVPIQVGDFRAERLARGRVRLSWTAARGDCLGYRLVARTSAEASTGPSAGPSAGPPAGPPAEPPGRERIVADVRCGAFAGGLGRYEVVDEFASGSRVLYRLEEIGSDQPVVLAMAVAPEASRIAAIPTPNPSGGAVRIGTAFDPSVEVVVEIHDAGGRLVRRIDTRSDASGTISWDGALEDGSPAAPGVYWMRLRSGREERSWRVTIAR